MSSEAAAAAATGGGGNATSTVRPFYMCDAPSAICRVEITTLGYYPNQGANIFFAVAFAICAAVSLVLGISKKTWSYTVFFTAGCLLEVAGYGARAALSINPFNREAFETQICAIILAPTLICVSIYLTLKHVTLGLSPELSRIPPRIYPFIFVPADVSCLLIQAIGGALAAAASNPSNPGSMDLVQGGNRAIIAGVSLQVAVLLAFGLASIDYFIRVKKWIVSGDADPEALALWNDKKFRKFVCAVTVAFSAILIRCIYRIAEMAGGWGNHIMQDEPSFMVLDATMVLIACTLLAGFAPGLFFPQMAERMNAPSRREKKQKKEKKADGSSAPVSGVEDNQDPEQGATPPVKAEREPKPVL